jgi:acyl-CoA synthetase (AMP-forming)/AMP-acid ligase II
MAPDLREIEARLTAPGGMFEVVTEDVRGTPMRVFKNRPRSLRALLEGSRAHGDKDYIVYTDTRISYAQHFARASAFAQVLRERYGVGPGDRVAICAANRPEWVIAFWATVASGGVVAALNGWWTEDEIRYGIDDCDPKVVIGDRGRLARLGGRDAGAPILEIESMFAELEAGAAGKPLPDVEVAEDDPAVILYTSGTTGRPKGAVNTHRGICGFVTVNMCNGLKGMIYASESGRAPAAGGAPTSPAMLVTVPLFHLSGLYSGCVMMLAVGAKTVYRPGRFDPEDVLRLIERERITTWPALGNMPHRVVSHPAVSKYDLSSMNNIGGGGGPTSPEIQRRLREVFPTSARGMGLGYGLSESVTAVATITGDELIEHPTSVGRPAVTHEIEIRDPEGKPVPEGVEGEIYIRSPYLMLGYWRKPEPTREALVPGGWLRTGDIGHFEDGRLYINSRARDMILRGGENIYPVEIEHRIEAHPDVAEAAVLGVDHEELGQEVKAVVVPRPGARPDPAALAAWVGETLAAYKVPAHWELRAEPLPRNAAGKVLKNVLTGAAQNQFVED